VIQLDAGIPQACDFDNGRVAQMQPRPGWQSKQINAARRDILTHLPGCDGESSGPELVMEFSMDQVDLAQVGLARVTCYP
jgi:hypothetical protein